MKPVFPPLAAALLLATGVAFAAPAEQTTDVSSSEVAATDAGMRVYIDPETGRLSPVPITIEQQRFAESSKSVAPMAPMVERRLADGTVLLDLNGNYEMASTVAVGADGKLVSACVDAAHAADPAHVHVPAAATIDEK